MPAGAQRCARAVVEYDGTAFAGSQYQPNVRTVQGELEEALNRLTGRRVRIRLAGRTDAGVHAAGQVAAFCLPRRKRGVGLSWPDLLQRLNAMLPPDLALRTLRPASPGFDPRRDARTRVYRYRILDAGERRPLERYRTLEIDDALDVSAMRAAAAVLVGERDFGALGSHPHRRTVRRVDGIAVRRRGPRVEITVTANAFLRRMVRSMVAVLIEVGRGRLSIDEVAALMRRGESGQRALHGRAVPARGLTLERVTYSNTKRRTTALERAGT